MQTMLSTIGLDLTLSGALPNTAVGVAASYTLTARGGTPPYIISVVSETLPPEWTITPNTDGTVDVDTAASSIAGDFQIVFLVEDANRDPRVITRSLRVVAQPLEISGTLDDGEAGQAISASLAITGGVPPYSIVLSGGLGTYNVVGSSVVISGNYPTAGSYLASVTIQDATGTQVSWSQAVEVVAYYDFVALPLTYDEVDYAGTMTWVRQGNGPHVTPDGFEGDGYEARLKSTTIPAWMTSASALLTMHATVQFYPQQLKSTAEFVLYAGTDAATPASKLIICTVPDATNSLIAQLAVRGGTGGVSFVEKLLGRSDWQYQFRAPDLTIGGFEARPQALLFLDADTLIVSAHFEDTMTRVWKVDPDTATVLGYFDCTGDWAHIGVMARRANGDVWVGSTARKICKVDLDASFAAGTMQFSTVISHATFDVGGIEFVTVSGTEYLLLVQYVTSGTPYFYTFVASTALALSSLSASDRYKRFTGPAWETQGACMRSGKLFTASNDAVGGAGAQRWGHIHRFDLVTAISSTADGGAMNSEARWDNASKYAEDISVHPTTNDLWSAIEGITAVGSDDGGLSVWSSPLDGSLATNHITAEFDGASTTVIKVNNRAYDTMPGALATTVACVTVGGPPATAAGITARYFTGYVRNVMLQNGPLDQLRYDRATSGYYEPSVLTAYTFTMTNPGAESGSATGWTAESGGVAALLYPSATATVPHSGNYFFSGGTSATTIARQRFDIAAQTGLSGAQIDAGGIWAKVRWWQASIDATQDPAGMGLRTLTGALVTQSTVYSGIVATPNSSGTYRPWYPRCFAMDIPTNGRHVDALQRMNRSSGTNNDGWIDDVTMTVYRR